MADALTGCTVLNAVWTVPDNMLDELDKLSTENGGNISEDKDKNEH